MKTLTTLTVAAVLAVGMSAANAQSSTRPLPNGHPSTTGAGQMDKMNKSDSMGKMNRKMTVKGKGRFCSQIASGGPLNCQYASRAACEKVVKPGLKRNCVANPHYGTTGAK